MTLTLQYDADLELVGVANGDAFYGGLYFTGPGRYESGCNVFWDGIDPSFANGEILVLTFEVSQTAVSGKHNISLSYVPGDIADGEYQPVEVSVTNGGIIVA